MRKPGKLTDRKPKTEAPTPKREVRSLTKVQQMVAQLAQNALDEANRRASSNFSAALDTVRVELGIPVEASCLVDRTQDGELVLVVVTPA